jgi:signal transduction histidine kinase
MLPGGLKARIVVPTVAVYLLTVGAGYALTELLVRGEMQRRREETARRQDEAEARALRSARELAKLPVAWAGPSARLATEVLGHPFFVLDETRVAVSTLEGPADDALRARHETLRELMEDLPEGREDLSLGDRAYRLVWTPAAVEPRLGQRPAWLGVLIPAAAEPPQEPPLLRAFAGIALAGATVLAAVGLAIGWFWARRVRRLAERVDAFLPAVEEGPPDPARQSTAAADVADSDEVRRLSAAFDRLRGRLESYRAELVARERLATAGRIAAMMAHEIRNPLTALKLSAQMLAEESSARGDDSAVETLGMMDREIGRLQILCDQLLTLSGKRRTVRGPTDPGMIVRDVCRLLSGQAERGRVRLEPVAPAPGEAPPLSADAGELRQLLMNLVLNALAAAPPGTAVTAEAAYRAGPPSAWTLRVIDRGPGIDSAARSGVQGSEGTAGPEVAGLLSNKPGGAGLGLAICRKIVDDHGGRLTLTDRGDGTTAEAEFPA